MANINMTEDQKTECKQLLDSYLEIVERAKEISAEKSAIVEHFARITETKKGVAGKTLKSLARKMDGEEPEEDEILSIIESLAQG